MADDKSAIKQRIALDATEATSTLKGYGEAGEKAFKRIKDAADSKPYVDAAAKIGQLKNSLTESSGIAERFREALHLVHPVLSTAGIDIGELGAFAKVASLGLAGLGVAVTGSVIVALGKMGDESKIARQRLIDLAQNPEAGKRLFEGIEKSANRAGASLETFQKPAEAALNARQALFARFGLVTPAGAPLPSGLGTDEQRNAAIEALIRRSRASGLGSDAEKASQKFITDLNQKGQLTADVVQELGTAAPGAANALAQSFNLGLQNYQQLIEFIKRNPLSLALQPGQVERAIGANLPQVPKGQEVRTISQSFSDLTHSVTSGARTSGLTESSSNLVIENIDRVKQGINDTFREIDEAKRLLQASGLTGDRGHQPPAIQSAAPNLLSEPSPVAGFGAGGGIAAIDTSAEKAAPSLDVLGNAASDAGQKLLDLVQYISTLASKPLEPVTESDNQSIGIRGALGGLISGPGTGRSDSILAAVSNGEFIVDAEGRNLGAALDHYSGRRMPRFADGGLVGSSSHHGTVDLRTDTGTYRVSAPRSVIADLHRDVMSDRRRSTGRAPSHFGG